VFPFDAWLRPIRVVRVVVVEIACRIHIPRVVRVVAIRGPQTHVHGGTNSLHPYESVMVGHNGTHLILSTSAGDSGPH